MFPLMVGHGAGYSLWAFPLTGYDEEVTSFIHSTLVFTIIQQKFWVVKAKM